ncbi:MAG: type 1 glutamine amidotransferase [Candidatus Mariimomonas ferrooxydans]
MMGGPMSVNEDEKYPFIKEEEKLVRDFISKGKKILGVCLGAQIMAKALGARVYMGNKEEVGWLDIELTEEGLMDLHMKNLAFNSATSEDPFRKFKVFHWHEETFDMPKGAVRLASSELYRNQAFRYGDKAYAFQFHIEVNKKMIYDWFKDNSAETHKLKGETDKFYDVYRRRAVNFYDAFFN